MHACISAFVCVSVFVRECVRACVLTNKCSCVPACMRAFVCVCVFRFICKSPADAIVVSICFNLNQL